MTRPGGMVDDRHDVVWDYKNVKLTRDRVRPSITIKAPLRLCPLFLLLHCLYNTRTKLNRLRFLRDWVHLSALLNEQKMARGSWFDQLGPSAFILVSGIHAIPISRFKCQEEGVQRVGIWDFGLATVLSFYYLSRIWHARLVIPYAFITQTTFIFVSLESTFVLPLACLICARRFQHNVWAVELEVKAAGKQHQIQFVSLNSLPQGFLKPLHDSITVQYYW